MSFLTEIFYIISTLLLVPVMIAILAILSVALWNIGTTFAQYGVRRKTAEEIRACEKCLDSDEKIEKQPILRKGLLVTIALMMERKEDSLYMEKLIAKVKNQWKSECDHLELIVRFGPSLGLMGTLIPLGPALLGLAQGNLESMAGNLIIAFATTVVGLLAGLIGLFLLSVKKRWQRDDVLLLTYMYERLCERVKVIAPSADEERE